MSEMDENSFDELREEFPFDDFEEETKSGDGPEASGSAGGPSSGKNCNFMVTVAILAGVFVVVVLVLVVLAAFFIPRNQQANLEEAAVIYAHNTATAQAAIDVAFQFTQDALPTKIVLPSSTPKPPTATPVVVIATSTSDPSTGTQVAGIGGPPTQLDQNRTATVAALLTQAAQGGTPVSTAAASSTPTGPTPTALPETGIADQMGFPGLFGLAVALLVVVVLVRRFRHVNS